MFISSLLNLIVFLLEKYQINWLVYFVKIIDQYINIYIIKNI